MFWRERVPPRQPGALFLRRERRAGRLADVRLAGRDRPRSGRVGRRRGAARPRAPRAAAGQADRRAGRAARAVRDEQRGRDRADLRRLPAHGLRRLAVAESGAGAPARRGPLRPPRGRPYRARRRGMDEAPAAS
jgi:hypothetical protein